MRIHERVRQVTEENTQHLRWGHICWLVGASLIPGAEQTLGVVTIYPGLRNPLHAHPNCEELLYVVSGECEHKLGDEIVRLGPGSVICITRATPHWARCISQEPLVAVVSFSDPDRRTENFESDDVA